KTSYHKFQHQYIINPQTTCVFTAACGFPWYIYWLNSIGSLFGPVMVKNQTPFSQNVRNWIVSWVELSPSSYINLYASSISFTLTAMWSIAPSVIFAALFS